MQGNVIKLAALLGGKSKKNESIQDGNLFWILFFTRDLCFILAALCAHSDASGTLTKVTLLLFYNAVL